MTATAPARTAEEARGEILGTIGNWVERRRLLERQVAAEEAFVQVYNNCSESERERLIALFWKG